ncbi:DNA polymerase V [Filimonas lacunae]|uniref:DNA polymerase V n=1 Tax=Filimonas lacunae TaxID=477680 RepID=A0A173MB64_9BACT|nr:Y-family DNA polymerase [Filimonas lacunae]BAV04760.1 error-prone, lesion bypass DNA polymerase UmuC [Filimonas lacunae]SIT32147.1 DNA polymerase V [Filimonas lacunae]
MYSLVDCNSFYCSCERLFQPKFKQSPVVVLSNNDGCAISRTDEAKALGITMGTPGFMLEQYKRQNGLIVFSSNYALYQDMSDRVMSTLSGMVKDIEVYSIDEAFLDISGYTYHNLFEFGKEIRQQVLMHTGIPVGVGIAATKTLAKMANRYAKKQHKHIGVYNATTEESIQQMMQDTPVEDIWGIGSQRAKLLLKHNIKTAADLVKVSEEWIRKHMNVTGLRLLKELKGIACIEWEPDAQSKQGICTGRSFGTIITEKKFIDQAVADYTENCARKLRKQGSCTSRIQVFLQTNPHRVQDQQYFRSATIKIPVATSDTAKLLKYAQHALNIIYRHGYNYQRAGVLIDSFVSDNNVQLGMFSTPDSENSKKMSQVYDALNSHYGKGTVRFARQGFEKPYALRAQNLSPRYTTRLSDIIKAK